MDDLEAIRQLKYRYVRFLDTKAWEDYTETFVPEATADYAGLVFGDRAALVDYMRTNMTAEMITLHQVHHPEITVDGDTASGTWYLQDKVMVPAYKFVLEGAAFYEDRYVRTADGWRIAHTGYRRTYEMTWSTDDLASVKIKQNPTH